MRVEKARNRRQHIHAELVKHVVLRCCSVGIVLSIANHRPEAGDEFLDLVVGFLAWLEVLDVSFFGLVLANCQHLLEH